MMHATDRLLALAQALADPLRLVILQRLLEGPASAAELTALVAATQPRVANHLALLRQRGMVRRTRLGRQAVYELRNALVADLIESVAGAAGDEPREQPTLAPLAKARTCYDHLAGKYGVAVFDALLAAGAMAYEEQAGRGGPGEKANLAIGPAADRVFPALGVDVRQAAHTRRQLVIACIDWTERRPHLGGALGAAVWRALVERGWLSRQPGTREVIVTPTGKQGLQDLLGIRLETPEEGPT